MFLYNYETTVTVLKQSIFVPIAYRATNKFKSEKTKYRKYPRIGRYHV